MEKWEIYGIDDLHQENNQQETLQQDMSSAEIDGAYHKEIGDVELATKNDLDELVGNIETWSLEDPDGAYAFDQGPFASKEFDLE